MLLTAPVENRERYDFVTVCSGIITIVLPKSVERFEILTRNAQTHSNKCNSLMMASTKGPKHVGVIEQ
jgi:hypothetical protein